MLKAIEAFVRRKAGVRSNMVPVYIVDDWHGPVVDGDAGGWHTKGGTPIRSPGAYSRKGWSNMTYQTDDRVVWVGQGWIDKQILRIVRRA